MVGSDTAIPVASTSNEERRARADIAASFQVIYHSIFYIIFALFISLSMPYLHNAIYFCFLLKLQKVAILHLEDKCQRAIEWALKIEPSISHLVCETNSDYV